MGDIPSYPITTEAQSESQRNGCPELAIKTIRGDAFPVASFMRAFWQVVCRLHPEFVAHRATRAERVVHVLMYVLIG